MPFFLLEHLFCVSHCKIHWTMSVDNLGLNEYILGTLELHGHSNIFSLVQTEVVLGHLTTNQKNDEICGTLRKYNEIWKNGCMENKTCHEKMEDYVRHLLERD